MRIDEALLRHRDQGERPDFETTGSLSEHLQLVHYDPGQEYTAHHDFGFSDLSDLQGESVTAGTLLAVLTKHSLIHTLPWLSSRSEIRNSTFVLEQRWISWR
jgi:hypothetical protein